MNSHIIYAIGGGLLIGSATLLMLGLLGRITGISGMLWQALSNTQSYRLSAGAWRWFFMIGLLLGPIIVHEFLGWQKPSPSNAGLPMAIIAGLLVGIGTKLGSGCTSGHAICGLGRFSQRSIVATLCFMAAGTVTVFINQHLVSSI